MGLPGGGEGGIGWKGDRRTFPVLRLTASWTDDHFVGQTSAVGQPTRPTQPFILTGSIDERKGEEGSSKLHQLVL